MTLIAALQERSLMSLAKCICIKYIVPWQMRIAACNQCHYTVTNLTRPNPRARHPRRPPLAARPWQLLGCSVIILINQQSSHNPASRLTDGLRRPGIIKDSSRNGKSAGLLSLFRVSLFINSTPAEPEMAGSTPGLA